MWYNTGIFFGGGRVRKSDRESECRVEAPATPKRKEEVSNHESVH